MKFSEKWLRAWVNPSITTQQLTDQLTQLGFECESVISTAPGFHNVVVGEVIAVVPHPNADRLRYCTVMIGQTEPLYIVCGAANVRTGLKVAVILIGGRLPGNITIEKTKLRGVESHGMICSLRELGLSEESKDNNKNAGILELPLDAPVGLDLNQYLDLDDHVIDIAITPNRGDCLSILGIAREIAAYHHLQIVSPLSSVPAKPSHSATTQPVIVQVLEPEACPRYIYRTIRHIKKNAETPIWMRERLRRAGQRLVHPVVDVMNYVMLELGQPLHAFDLNKLSGPIEVRFAKMGETVELLDGTKAELTTNTLVIADQKQIQALAGIMGAAHSAVTVETQDLFLESAFFAPNHIAPTVRRMGLHSEASHRFERGVDFMLQHAAIERATELLQQIVGGEAGSLQEFCYHDFLPKRNIIPLRPSEIKRLLGMTLSDHEIITILTGLGMSVVQEQTAFAVSPPPYRFDIVYEADLIEELARIHGYEKIPMTVIGGMGKASERPLQNALQSLSQLRHILVQRSYSETVTFSFVEPILNQQLNPTVQSIPVTNPISSEMSVMRSSLWPGLINVLRYNLHREARRIRLFEIGHCFWGTQINNEWHNEWQEVPKLAGLITGDAHTLQWGETARSVDFYDMKGDVSVLLSEKAGYRFEAVSQSELHPALHPAQSAAIYYRDRLIGFMGALHPKVANQLDLKITPFLFEFSLEHGQQRNVSQYQALSRFPSMRRDLAIIVSRTLLADRLTSAIRHIAGRLLSKIEIFDIYIGEGIESDKKSVALGLTFQDPSRTLVDEEINQIMERIVTGLSQQFHATLRA